MPAISASGELGLPPPPLVREGVSLHTSIFCVPPPYPPPQAGEGTAPSPRPHYASVQTITLYSLCGEPR